MPILSRRGFIATSAASLAAAAGPSCRSQATPQDTSTGAASVRGDRILLKGGCVISLDQEVAILTADVL